MRGRDICLAHGPEGGEAGATLVAWEVESDEAQAMTESVKKKALLWQRAIV